MKTNHKMKPLNILAIFLIELIMLFPVSHALSISNVQVAPSADAAVITWQTDVLANSEVKYGLTSALGLNAVDYTTKTSHSITLNNLIDDKNYYYSIFSAGTGGSANTSITQFRTLDATPPAQPVALSANATRTSIRASWAINSESDLAGYMVFLDGLNLANVTTNSHIFTNLTPGTDYFIEVAAFDSSFNQGARVSTAVMTIEPDVTPPTIQNTNLSDSTANTIRINWQTDEPATSTIYYATETFYNQYTLFDNEQTDATLTESHSTSLTNLVERTKYKYQIRSCDESGNCGESTVMDFIAGIDLIPPTIDFTLPTITNQNSIPLTVTTENQSTLYIYVNNLVVATQQTDETGIYTFTSIPLDVTRNSNTIKVKAIDLFNNSAEESGTIAIDQSAPSLNMRTIPTRWNSTSLTLIGNVTEDVQLVIYNYVDQSDTTPPEKVRNIRNTSTGPTSVSITWDTVVNSTEYLVYRDDISTGNPIAITQLNAYYDNSVRTNSQYTYRVSARDDSCNEGAKSDPLIIRTPFDHINNTNNVTALTQSCDPLPAPIINRTISGSFRESISLQDGTNTVIVKVFDTAGNFNSVQQDVFLDSQAPTISSIDFARHSPSYAPTITITGSVSEPATLYIFQNLGHDSIFTVGVSDGAPTVTTGNSDDPDYVIQTDENGSFTKTIRLQRAATFRCGQTSATATDCTLFADNGNGWENNFQVVAVDTNGMRSAVYTGDIVYALCGQGNSDWNIQTSSITPSVLIPRHLLDGVAEYGFTVNLEWQGPGSEEYTSVQSINFNDAPTMSDSEETYWDNDWISNAQRTITSNGKSAYFLVSLDAYDGAGNTTMEMERNLSSHRLGQCAAGLVPVGYGCARFFVQLEITYTYQDPFTGESTTGIYHQCVQQEIAIDQRLPSDQIPAAFLNQSIQALTAAINAIDQILPPLRLLRNYIFMACLGSWLVHYFLIIIEWGSCNQEILDIGGQGCDHIDNPNTDSDDDKVSQCQSCLSARQTTASFWQTSQWLCDRIICNSAPTFEKYVSDQKSKSSHCYLLQERTANGTSIITDENQEGFYDLTSEECNNKEKYYQRQPVPRFLWDTTSDAYGNYLTEYGEDEGVYSEACCKREYKRYSDSICVMMDELEESGCLNQQSQNSTNRAEMGLSTCGGLNSVVRTISGICSSDELSDVTLTHSGSQPAGGSSNTYKVYVTGNDDSQRTAYAVDIEGQQSSSGNANNQTNKFQLAGTQIPTAQTGSFYVLGPMLLSSRDCTLGDDDDEEGDEVTRPTYEEWAASTGNSNEYKGSTYSQWITTNIYGMICTPDEDQVVDPTSGILRSIQCVCLTALVQYLTMWKNVLVITRNCFQTILVTGDGSSGMCRSFLSVYLCDLIYYAIRCVIERAGTSYSGQRGYTGLGGFASYVSNAGSSVENGIQGRYGQSTIFRQLFNERKLMHAICLFAFTGDWTFDINTFLDSEAITPVASIAVVAPAFRRFQTKNPANQGRATFLYHIGAMLVPGAQNVRWQLKLVCDTDNSCRASEGFTNSYCDCSHTGSQQTHNVASGSLRFGQTLNEEYYVQARDQDVRYNRAVLEYQYTNNQGQTITTEAEFPITQQGGSPPLDCSFDVAAGFFHCAFNTGSASYAEFSGDPTVGGSSSSASSISINQPITVYGTVNKASTSSTSNDVFYIRARLRDTNSLAILADKDNYWNIGGAGTYTLNPAITGWTVNQEMFQATPQIVPSQSTLSGNMQGSIDVGPTTTVSFRAKSGTCSNPTGGHQALVSTTGGSGNINVKYPSTTSSQAVGTWFDYTGGGNAIYVYYTPTSYVKVIGTPAHNAETNTQMCTDSITITPGGSGGAQTHRAVTLELTLHRGNSSYPNGFDQTPIIHNGAQQRKNIPFTITTVQTAAGDTSTPATATSCGDGTSAVGACDCNGDGDTSDTGNPTGPLVSGHSNTMYTGDCNGNPYKYCVQQGTDGTNGICTRVRKCSDSPYTTLSNPCIYQTATGNWQYATTSQYFYGEEARTIKRCSATATPLTAQCNCEKADSTYDTCAVGATCQHSVGCI